MLRKKILIGCTVTMFLVLVFVAEFPSYTISPNELMFASAAAGKLFSNSDTFFPTPPGLVRYDGPVPHIFFHSLIIYPQLAAKDTDRLELYENNMITVDQFKTILQDLYNDGFVLIDSRLLYSVGSDGAVRKNAVYVPPGKKPLVLSQDDLDYYETMQADGFAHKLVLQDGRVETQVITPEGATIVTDDGDVIPIVDAFIKMHPDFSLNGARGVIGVTGYDGILGYRTQLQGLQGDEERAEAAPVVDAIKKEGWVFASHSYSHALSFLRGDITLAALTQDIADWNREVEPLVGPTDIYIGPFGVLFSDNDPRRAALAKAGFHVMYGVGIDGYERYFGTYAIMDRINIDGLRLRASPAYLRETLGIYQRTASLDTPYF